MGKIGESHYFDLENNVFKRSGILVTLSTVILFRTIIKIISQILLNIITK